MASRIPEYDSNGAFSGWLTVNGEIATTRLDESLLKQIAAATDGAYSRVLSGRELGQTLGRLRIAGPAAAGAARELFQWPLAAALLLLAFERLSVGLIGWRWPGVRSSPARSTANSQLDPHGRACARHGNKI